MKVINLERTHLAGIDWIRAFASLAVVAIHYQAFSGIIKSYVLYLAVPLFMLVSIFLFARKERTFSELVGKVAPLLFWAVVWPMVFYISNGGFPALVSAIGAVCREILTQPLRAVYFVMSTLETVYYFFLSLAFTLVITFVFQRRRTGFLAICFLASILIVGFLPFVFDGSLAVFNNPLNFLPYGPGALLLVKFSNRISTRGWLWGLVFLVIGLGFIFLESGFQSMTSVIMSDGYTRNSLIFIAAAVLVYMLPIRQTNRLISYMSSNSLPLYLFHTCLYTVVGTAVNILYTDLLNGPRESINIVSWVVAVILSYVISSFLAPRMFVSGFFRGS